MNVNLGDADAAIGIALDLITDFLAALMRIGRLPNRREFDRDVGGQLIRVTVLLDPPKFEMVTTGPDAPRTRLHLLGTIEVRPAADPNATPTTFPLDAAVKLAVVLFPGEPASEVGFRYDGVDGTPALPVTAADINDFMTSADVQDILSSTRIPIADPLVEGLNASRFKDAPNPPQPADWSVELFLTPASSDTVDAFAIAAGPPGTSATLAVTESFVAPRTGLAIAYARGFLDLMLARGAAAKVASGEKVDGATVTSLTMVMADTGIDITGHVVRDVSLLGVDALAPDVDIDFDGIAIPRLIRGTTGMTMDTSGIEVDVDDTDEAFYWALKWVLTVGSMALLFTGVGILAAIGIASWVIVVPFVWNKVAQLDNADNVLRDNLAASLGATFSKLVEALDQSTPVGELKVDGTPDSLVVVEGNIVMFAQVIVESLMMMRLRSAEYSHRLRRFVIFELEDRRRFRAQELARLMKAGKISVSGFHHVGGRYIRSDHDNSAANNLLQSFKSNETNEVVVKNI